MSSPLKYAVDEKVLAYHGPLLYPAKVLETQVNDGTPAYKLHYLGWSSKWDEWVDSSRIIELTPENEAKAAELQANLKAGKAKRKEAVTSSDDDEPSSSSTSSSSSSQSVKKSRKSQKGEDDADADPSVDYDEVKAGSINIKIIGPLKRQLVVDWENVAQRQELVSLPRRPAISDILAEYLTIKGRPAAQQEQVEEVVSGLRQLFDRALPLCLLYKFERPQYSDLVKTFPTAPPSTYFGGEHLLRLFLKLPALLSNTRMDACELEALQARVNDFLRWLQTRNDFFSTEYVPTDKDYRRRALNL